MYRVILRTVYKSGNHEDLGMTHWGYRVNADPVGGQELGTGDNLRGWYYAVTIHKNVARSSRWSITII